MPLTGEEKSGTGGPATASLALYAAANAICTGSPLPVSATVKAGVHHFRLSLFVRAGDLGGLARNLAGEAWRSLEAGPVQVLAGRFPFFAPGRERTWAVGLVVLGILFTRWQAVGPGRALGGPAERRVWRAALVGAALHFVAMISLIRDFPRHWHWVAETSIVVVCLPAMLLEPAAAAVSRFVPVAAARIRAYALGIALFAWIGAEGLRIARLLQLPNPTLGNQTIEMARHWGRRLPAGTRIGAWNAGYLAYFTELQVVNLDGLVNSPDFFDRIQRDGLLAYLRGEGIGYLVDALDAQAAVRELEGRVEHLETVEKGGFRYGLWRVPEASG